MGISPSGAGAASYTTSAQENGISEKSYVEKTKQMRVWDAERRVWCRLLYNKCYCFVCAAASRDPSRASPVMSLAGRPSLLPQNPGGCYPHSVDFSALSAICALMFLLLIYRRHIPQRCIEIATDFAYTEVAVELQI